MIEILTGMPANVIGVHVTGKLTAEDYEQVLIPALEKQLEAGDGLRVVIRFGGDDDLRLTPGAIWDDFKLGLGQARNWKRLAIVSDSEALAKAMHLIGWMFPGEAKTFTEAELESAKSWAAA